MPIKTLFIANRGEIAVRIIRAARQLGLRTVQAYSEADASSLPVKLADKAVCIGKSPASRSYLNIDAVIAAAKGAGADAVHPGYGFLAENGDFADAVEKANMIFVGPHSSTIRNLGDKVMARKAAANIGLPTVPGSSGRLENLEAAEPMLNEIGFPVMIKAAAGGGGRGIRTAFNRDDFNRLAPQAILEAQTAFGDGGIYIEAYIQNARHVEVQVLGDGERVIHCYDRECSLQRRRQKVWEEAPAPPVPDHVRQGLCQEAVKFAESVGYRGAGTLEFLYDAATEQYYFLEMNTRIQVEHPVTELVTGIDLVREAIRIASGNPLRHRQEDIVINGHAIECRINAEDPENDFMPNPGTVDSVTFPGGPGVRFDTMLFSGCSVPPFYDSLLGKLIVWDDSRPRALRRLCGALDELEISGIKTTKPLHLALVDNERVAKCDVHTDFLDEWLSDFHFSKVNQGG